MLSVVAMFAMLSMMVLFGGGMMVLGWFVSGDDRMVGTAFVLMGLVIVVAAHGLSAKKFISAEGADGCVRVCQDGAEQLERQKAADRAYEQLCAGDVKPSQCGR